MPGQRPQRRWSCGCRCRELGNDTLTPPARSDRNPVRSCRSVAKGAKRSGRMPSLGSRVRSSPAWSMAAGPHPRTSLRYIPRRSAFRLFRVSRRAVLDGCIACPVAPGPCVLAAIQQLARRRRFHRRWIAVAERRASPVRLTRWFDGG